MITLDNIKELHSLTARLETALSQRFDEEDNAIFNDMERMREICHSFYYDMRSTGLVLEQMSE